jgi:hypothetical protein
MARRLAVLAALAAFLSGCPKRATASQAECNALYERFLDLKLADDPRLKSMTVDERATARKALVPSVASDSDVQQVTRQCETEVTREEYDCAIKATTSVAWNECIN